MNHETPTTHLHPAFDWLEVTRLALASRMMDEMEEKELTPKGGRHLPIFGAGPRTGATSHQPTA